MKTLLKQPCPHCGRQQLHKGFDPDYAYCRSCWTEQFIGEVLPEPGSPVPEEMLKGHLRRARRHLLY